jgi:CRP/FNR family transcriptional regulator, cyclic AMP receptor protein
MVGTTIDIEVIAAADLGSMRLFDGGVVYSQGDLGDRAYIVRAGKIEIRGVGCAIEVIAPGEIFGEMALLDDQPRSCSAVALGDTELIPVSRWLFHALLIDDPEFALTIMRLIVRRLRAALAQLDASSGDLPLAPRSPPLSSRASL